MRVVGGTSVAPTHASGTAPSVLKPTESSLTGVRCYLEKKGDYLPLGVNQVGMATLVPSESRPGTETPSTRNTNAERPQSIRVEEFRGDAAEWDRYVRGSVNGTFCHLS